MEIIYFLYKYFDNIVSGLIAKVIIERNILLYLNST